MTTQYSTDQKHELRSGPWVQLTSLRAGQTAPMLIRAKCIEWVAAPPPADKFSDWPSGAIIGLAGRDELIAVAEDWRLIRDSLVWE